MSGYRSVSRIPSVDLGHAAIHLVDQGAGEPLNLAQAHAATAHLAGTHTKAELTDALSYLACQVIGYRNARNQRSDDAMRSVAALVDRWREDTR